nr:unnamed protein product [Spirometra erinaceieuropaei]
MSVPLDSTGSSRPKWRTALVPQGRARHKLDIAVFSETRFSKQGQLEEVGADYTFLWRGRPNVERWDAGVAFADRSHIVEQLPCLPQSINGRLTSPRLSLRGGKFSLIVSVYISLMISSGEEKTKFYKYLHALLETFPKGDKLVVLCVFKECAAWRSAGSP